MPPENTAPNSDIVQNGANQAADRSDTPTLTQEHLDFLNGLKGAFRPPQAPSKPDPTSTRQGKLKDLTREIDHAVLSNIQAGGNGMPLTSKVAYELSETAEHILSENQELRKELNELKNKTQLQSDPNYRGITTIQDNAELLISDAVDALYGTPDANDPRANLTAKMKDHQKDSFHALVSDHINDLIQKNDIKAIKALQKPTNLRALISELGESVLPPKARDVLKAEALANRPPDPQALYAEMREANQKAKEAKTPAEQRQWEDIATRARRRYLGTRFGKRR